MVTVCEKVRRKVVDRRRRRRRWSRLKSRDWGSRDGDAKAASPSTCLLRNPVRSRDSLSLSPCPLSLLVAPLHVGHINHGRLPETHHLSVGDSHLHLCLLCPVFRGCQGPQDHPQGIHLSNSPRCQLLT
jgi:hypothetical protein